MVRRLFVLLTVFLASCAACFSSRAGAQPPAAPEVGQPELALQIGHSHSLTSITFSPDGRWIATGSMDGSVRLWDARTRELHRVLRPQKATKIHAVTFSPDSQLVAAGGPEGGPHVWDARSGELIQEYQTWWQDAVVLGPGPIRLAEAGADVLCLWSDLTLKRPSRSWRLASTLFSLAISSDGTQLAVGARECLYLWRFGDSEPRRLPAKGEIRGVTYFRDGRSLVTASSTGEVCLWDAQAGRVSRVLFQGDEGIAALALAPDEKTLAGVGGKTGTVWLWYPQDGRLLRTFRTGPSGVRSLAFSPDSRTLGIVGSDTTARLWDLASGTPLEILAGGSSGEGAVAFSPDGKTLAVGEGQKAGVIRLWDVRAGTLIRGLYGSRGMVRAVAYAPSGRLLASGGGEEVIGELRLWDPVEGKLLHSFGWQPGDVRSVAFSPDETLLASGSYKTLKLWDVRTRQCRWWKAGHDHWVTGVAFSPDGTLLATSSADRTVKLWRVDDGTLLRTLKGHRDWVASVAFHPQGRLLASGAWDDTVRLWNVETGRQETYLRAERRWQLSLAFSPDGKILAAGTSRHSRPYRSPPIADRPDPAVLVWDVEKRTLRSRLYGHQEHVFSVAFSPDGRHLAAWSPDASANLWNWKEERLLASLRPVPRPEGPRPIPADSRPIGADSRPLPADSRPLGDPGSTADEDYLVVLPGGYYAGSAAADRYVRFRLGGDLFPAECFQARYDRPDLVRQVLAGGTLPQAPRFFGVHPPTVRFLSPPTLQLGKRGGSVLLEAADDSDVRKLVVLVNGRRLPALVVREVGPPNGRANPASVSSPSRPPPRRTRRRFSAAIPPVPGEGPVRIQAIAYDDDGLRSPREELALAGGPASEARGRLYGLCLGVSRFDSPELSLKYPARDAEAVAEALRQQGHLYTAATITTLTDGHATRTRLREALQQLAVRVRSVDTVVLFLATHGWRSPEGAYFLATRELDPERVRQTAMPWNEVVARLRELSARSRRVLVFLDACYSGSAATNEELVREALRGNAGVLIFASSRAGELSIERAESGHGAFTEALLEALQGRAHSGAQKHLSLWEFVTYVRRRVPELTGGVQHPQVPFLQDFDTDAPIATKR